MKKTAKSIGPGKQPKARREAANLWLTRFHRGLTPAESDAFARWLRTDPLNEITWGNRLMFWGPLEAGARPGAGGVGEPTPATDSGRAR